METHDVVRTAKVQPDLATRSTSVLLEKARSAPDWKGKTCQSFKEMARTGSGLRKAD